MSIASSLVIISIAILARSRREGRPAQVAGARSRAGGAGGTGWQPRGAAGQVAAARRRDARRRETLGGCGTIGAACGR
eukprot:scaffold13071_cov61-Phaeocystis_antarctica.AAC.4